MCVCTSVIHTQMFICNHLFLPTEWAESYVTMCWRKASSLIRPIFCNFRNIYFHFKQSSNSDQLYCSILHITKNEIKQKNGFKPHPFQIFVTIHNKMTIYV